MVTILKCIDISNQYMCTDLHSAVGQLCFKNKQASKQIDRLIEKEIRFVVNKDGAGARGRSKGSQRHKLPVI